MNRPQILHVGGTLFWVLRTRNPDTQVLKDADSTPTVVIRKNGASTGDSVTVTKRSTTTGIYDCSYNPAGEIEGDEFTVEESATVTGTTTAQATYSISWEFTVIAVERGTDGALKPLVANRQIAISETTGKVTAEAVELDSAITTQLNTIETDAAASVGYLTSLTTAVSAITAIFAGMTSLPNWLRRAFRKDAGTAGMITAQTEINTGGTATFAGATDALEAIRDNQQASTGPSLNDIVAGVQSVSGGIIAAQDSSAFYITQGDTWTQAVEGLGNLADKTVVFAIKKNTSDADTAAIVYLEEGIGLSRLNGAATTAGWGSITIDDDAAGDITLRLESNATVLLKTGTYIDAVKAKESADDRTLRQRGKTIVSGGVIDSIS